MERTLPACGGSVTGHFGFGALTPVQALNTKKIDPTLTMINLLKPGGPVVDAVLRAQVGGVADNDLQQPVSSTKLCGGQSAAVGTKCQREVFEIVGHLGGDLAAPRVDHRGPSGRQ